jgi:hypothetical protein
MSHLTASIAFIFLAISSAWAQTTAPAPGATPGAGGTAGTSGGMADYWWVILLVVVIAAAIWYFSRGRKRI